MAIQKPTMNSKSKRWLGVLTMVVVAFFASYAFAVAKTGGVASTRSVAGSTLTAANPAGAAGAAAGSGAISDYTPATGAQTGGGTQAGSTSGGDTGAPITGSCACCGGGGAPGGGATKAATVDGGVQKISVDLSKGYYDPTTIELKAGVPAEITFGQSSGCTGAVQSQSLNFYEDLTAGPKTVKLPALEPGTYQFTCGMQMVSGSIVVK